MARFDLTDFAWSVIDLLGRPAVGPRPIHTIRIDNGAQARQHLPDRWQRRAP